MADTKSESRVDARAHVEAAWCSIFGLDHVDRTANFFSLGGDSLRGMMLIADLQERLGITVLLADLLDAPTFDDFASTVAGPHREAELRQPSRRAGSPAPMTRLQLQRWKGRRHPVPGAEVSWVYRIDGHLDVAALSGAVDQLVLRHEILRTTFRRHRGRPRQVVQPWRPGYLRVIDMTDAPRRQREQAAMERLVAEDYRAFDYVRGPLIRPTLVRLDDNAHVFSLACCEMAVDGTSRHIVTNTLGDLYAILAEGGDPAGYPFPSLQFADIAVARRKLVPTSAYLEQVTYWRKRMPKIDPVIDMPDGLAGEYDRFVRRSLQLPPSLGTRVEATARAVGTTPFVILTAAFTALLGGIAARDEVAFTTTLAHRDLPGAEELIGAFYNNVFVSVATAGIGDSADLVGASADAVRESFRYGEVPFAQAEAFLPAPQDGRRGLRVNRVRFQMNDYQGELQLGRLRMQRLQLAATGGPDLALIGAWMPSGAVDFVFVHPSGLPKRFADAVLPSYRRLVSLLSEERPVAYREILRVAPQAEEERSARR